MAQSSFIMATSQEKSDVYTGFEGNPKGLPVTVKSRWPYAIAAATNSVVLIVAAN